jgi:hypothetical protein
MWIRARDCCFHRPLGSVRCDSSARCVGTHPPSSALSLLFARRACSRRRRCARKTWRDRSQRCRSPGSTRCRNASRSDRESPVGVGVRPRLLACPRVACFILLGTQHRSGQQAQPLRQAPEPSPPPVSEHRRRACRVCLRGGPGSLLRRSGPALRRSLAHRAIALAHSDRNLTLRTVATEKGEGDGSPELQSPSGPPHSLLGRAAVSQVNGSGSIEVDATRARLLASWPSPRGSGISSGTS